MNRGQFSIEFIVVFGALVMIVATTTIPLYQNSRGSVGKIKNMTLAKETADKFVHSINSAYIEGPGAKKTINYTLPEGVENIKIGDSEDSENFAEILIISNVWEGENTLTASTLLHKDNHPPIIFKNRDNMISPGEHKVSTRLELLDNNDLRIIIEEV